MGQTGDQELCRIQVNLGECFPITESPPALLTVVSETEPRPGKNGWGSAVEIDTVYLKKQQLTLDPSPQVQHKLSGSCLQCTAA